MLKHRCIAKSSSTSQSSPWECSESSAWSTSWKNGSVSAHFGELSLLSTSSFPARFTTQDIAACDVHFAFFSLLSIPLLLFFHEVQLEPVCSLPRNLEKRKKKMCQCTLFFSEQFTCTFLSSFDRLSWAMSCFLAISNISCGYNNIVDTALCAAVKKTKTAAIRGAHFNFMKKKEGKIDVHPDFQ